MKITSTTNNLAKDGINFWIYEIETPQGVRWTYARDADKLQFPGKALQTQQTWASKHGCRRGLSTHYRHAEIGTVYFRPPPMPLVTDADRAARRTEKIAELQATNTGEPAADQAPSGEKVVGTVDITPQWAGVLMILLTGYTDGTTEGRRIAITELRRMAQAADRYNALADAERKAFMAGHAAGEEGICGTPTEAGTAWQDYQKGKNHG